MVTHIQSRRNAAQRCMNRVMWLLEWDDENYCWTKYEYGLAYLQCYLPNDSYSQDILSRSGVYWNWWKNHWTIREEAYLMDAEKLDKLSLTTRRNAYKALHNPAALAAEIHPNAVVLSESYCEMIAHVK